MKGVLRRADRSIPDSEAYEILDRAEVGFLATASADGDPYVVSGEVYNGLSQRRRLLRGEVGEGLRAEATSHGEAPGQIRPGPGKAASEASLRGWPFDWLPELELQS